MDERRDTAKARTHGSSGGDVSRSAALRRCGGGRARATMADRRREAARGVVRAWTRSAGTTPGDSGGGGEMREEPTGREETAVRGEREDGSEEREDEGSEERE
ncbi:hypothetical protein Scep_007493 [Stephania cephalantha]|uniref:Uncharacterized protein n=1 Tax=Stephania cephalantha TaxID=152367 RepID=A0AAP0PQ42_9MAGN